MGIDPGSRFTGFGVVDWVNGAPRHVDSGVIALAATQPLAERLAALTRELEAIVARAQPQAAAVEKVFTAHNVRSALVLAHARGAIFAVFGKFGVPVFEYTASEVKASVTGYGRAEKQQLQKMVWMMLGIVEPARFDASDALAIGICHQRSARLAERTAVLRSLRT
jgi:crossover junction endodeoxyribonuclease RuvC